jgi:hypothetical protein
MNNVRRVVSASDFSPPNIGCPAWIFSMVKKGFCSWAD